MSRDLSAGESRCLNDEKDRLQEELSQCDFCSSSLEEHRACYVEVARESGERSKTCLS
ncbi:MAG: hypothetical protein ACOWWM_14095 [Desulfobacterales bacterium]